MSLRSVPWWGAFVSGLRFRSIDTFSEELGVPVDELVEALIEADPGGPAEEAPWWPEVVRLRATTSLRSLARRFRTEPRRLRRALARAGLRVGGAELAGRGVPALAGVRDRLGREPDAVLAREAGVPVEAVKGERRRLGIGPFRPGEPPAPALTAEEEAWIRGPEPVRRGRIRPEPEVLEVVRRPARAATRGERPDGPVVLRRPAFSQQEPAAGHPGFAQRRPGLAERPAPAERRPDLAERRPDLAERRPDLAERRPDLAERRPDLAERRPDLAERRVDAFPPPERRVDPFPPPERRVDPFPPSERRVDPFPPSERRVAAPDLRADPERTERDVRAAAFEPRADGDTTRRVGREFFRERAEDELARLLQPGPRARDGRQRIVREAAPRSSPAAARAPEPVLQRAEQAPPETPIVGTPAAFPAAQAHSAPPGLAAPLLVEPPTAPPLPAPPRAAAEPRATAPAEPRPVAPVEPRPARAAQARSVAPTAAPPAPPAPAPAHSVSPVTWLVRFPDEAPPMYVTAPDLASAAQTIVDRLPPALLARVGIELAGAAVGRPPAPADLLPTLPWVALG